MNTKISSIIAIEHISLGKLYCKEVYEMIWMGKTWLTNDPMQIENGQVVESNANMDGMSWEPYTSLPIIVIMMIIIITKSMN